MAAKIGNEGWRFVFRYIGGALIGVSVFVLAPETARWLHGGAFAQSPVAPPSAPGSGNCSNYGTFQGTMNNNCPTYNMPPRRQGGLYQDNQIIGLVAGAQPGPGDRQVTFQNLRISGGTVDLHAPFEFQNVMVKCPDIASMRGGAAMTAIAIAGPTTCEIVGQRQ